MNLKRRFYCLKAFTLTFSLLGSAYLVLAGTLFAGGPGVVALVNFPIGSLKPIVFTTLEPWLPLVGALAAIQGALCFYALIFTGQKGMRALLGMCGLVIALACGFGVVNHQFAPAVFVGVLECLSFLAVIFWGAMESWKKPFDFGVPVEPKAEPTPKPTPSKTLRPVTEV